MNSSQKIACSNCGSIVDSNAKKCSSCGNEFTQKQKNVHTLTDTGQLQPQPDFETKLVNDQPYAEEIPAFFKIKRKFGFLSMKWEIKDKNNKKLLEVKDCISGGLSVGGLIKKSRGIDKEK